MLLSRKKKRKNKVLGKEGLDFSDETISTWGRGGRRKKYPAREEKTILTT